MIPIDNIESRRRDMKTPRLILFGVFLSVTSLLRAGPEPKSPPKGTSPGAPAGRPGDDEGVRATLNAIVQAFQKGEARAVAERFTEDGEAVDEQGAAIRGRAAIEEHYAARLAASPGDKIETTIDSITY